MKDLMDSVISNTPPEGADTALTLPGAATQGPQSRATRNRSGYQLDATFIQNMSAGAEGTITESEQVINQYSGRPEYYFELQPFERRDDNNGKYEYVPLRPDATLRADRIYCVRVTQSLNRYNSSPDSIDLTYRLTQYPNKLPEEVSVYIEIGDRQHKTQGAVEYQTSQQGRLSLSDPNAQSHDFVFSFRKSYPLTVTIRLSFRNSEEEMLKLGATLELDMDGNDSAPPLNEVIPLLASMPPPASTAILHVTLADNAHLRLFGWAGKRADSSLKLDLEVFKWADIAADSDQATVPQTISQKFYDYNLSDAGAAVSDWFDKALGQYGNECSIVIVDETDSQIPWEMFKLRDGRYLGAHASIVRWARPQYGSPNATTLTDNTKFNGRICAYIHPTDWAKIVNDPMINRLLPKPSQDPEGLEFDLLPEEGLSQVGLVYLCYGGILRYGDEQEMLDKLPRSAPYMDDIKIRFDIVSGNLTPRPVFFANAPYSGRLLMSGQKSCGLANAILTQVAASYIGIMAPIERSYATRCAHGLLEAAASDAGVKPAEWLRQLRAAAVAKVMNKPQSKKDWQQARQEFAYPFMYVHYGHPHDWLKIDCAVGACEPEREGDDG